MESIGNGMWKMRQGIYHMDYGELNIDNFNEVAIYRVNNGAQSAQNREAKIKNEEFRMWRSEYEDQTMEHRIWRKEFEVQRWIMLYRK